MNPQQSIPRSPVTNSWRNRLACRLANWAMNKIATPDYRDLITALIRAGVDSAYGNGSARGRFDRQTGVRY